jgi:MYXO-CTERM domain-containing protein
MDFRHDAQRTNTANAPAKLASPAIRWRTFLGLLPSGLRTADVDLDGVDDVLLVEGGRLAARKLDGTLLWQTKPLGVQAVVAVAELDGIPPMEVVVRSTNGPLLVGLTTGGVEWAAPAALFTVGVAFAAVGDFDGDGRADLAAGSGGIAGSLPTGKISIWRFTADAQTLVQTENPLQNGVFELCLGAGAVDVDGDKALDIVIPEFTLDAEGKPHRRLGVFSGKTGKLVATSPQLDQTSPFGTAFVSVPAQDGGAPWLVWQGNFYQGNANQLMLGVQVFRLEGGTLTRKWQVLAQDPTIDRFGMSPSTAGDIDGDGKGEVLFSQWDGKVWSLHARDLATGDELSKLSAGSTAWPGDAGPLLGHAFRVGKSGPILLNTSARPTVDSAATAATRLVSWSRSQGFALAADLGVAQLGPGSFTEAADRVPLATQGRLAVILDANADGFAETLRWWFVQADAKAKQGPDETFPSVPRLQAMALTKTTPLALVATADGRVSAWRDDGVLANDFDGDGSADLRVAGETNPRMTVGSWRDSDATPVIAVPGVDRVVVLDPAAADPVTAPVLVWQVPISGSAAMPPLYGDFNGDGVREILLREQPVVGSGIARARDPSGKVVWQWTRPDPATYWSDGTLVMDVTSDGHDDLIAMTPRIANQTGYNSVIDGATGAELWTQDTVCGAISGVHTSIDVTAHPPRMVVASDYVRLTCRLSDGALIAKSPVIYDAGGYGMPMLGDCNGDGLADVVLGGGAIGPGAWLNDMSKAWSKPTPAGMAFYHAPAALVMVNGKLLYVQANVGSSRVVAYDAATGVQQWDRVYAQGQAFAPGSAPGIVSAAGLIGLADLTGGGVPAVVFRTSEGRLYAVAAADGAVQWSLDFGGGLGDPIAADVDGDGEVELLLTTSDGFLNAIDTAALAAPAWVREVVAPVEGGDPADIDQQEDSQRIVAQWDPVPGADGYGITLRDDMGGIIVPQKNIPATAWTEFKGLHLQPGTTYRVALAAYRAGTVSGEMTSYSPVVLSDGVTIVDNTGPAIDSFTAKLSAGPVLDLAATMHDDTRLTLWSMELVCDGISHWMVTSPLAVSTATVAAQVSPPDLPMWGACEVTLTVVDTAKHKAEAKRSFLLCTPGRFEWRGACVTQVPDALGVKGEKRASGCRSGPTGGPISGFWGLVALAVGVALRRRSRVAGDQR